MHLGRLWQDSLQKTYRLGLLVHNFKILNICFNSNICQIKHVVLNNFLNWQKCYQNDFICGFIALEVMGKNTIQ